ncbi:hypothetical protein COLO4_24307 [Corchorus olitorius]|uniref:Uncharacterized protein n=1 Tax=Corchorus olitorius TaxID=93759 RepID=A0A1R3IBB4_9ROSI|nr:hypothetical protein COLO4_24307 [Corchorus olitorius]
MGGLEASQSSEKRNQWPPLVGGGGGSRKRERKLRKEGKVWIIEQERAVEEGEGNGADTGTGRKELRW